MKKSKKRIVQQQKAEQIAQMEYEDSVGIRRKRFKPTFFTAHRIMGIKICLLASALAAFFLYSPLLIVIFICYGALYYISKRTERDANFGLKKHQRIKIPKLDSLIAVILVFFCVGGTLLSMATTSTRSSMFEGRTESQLRAVMEERGLSTSRIDSMIERMEEGGMFLTAVEKNILKIATCYTGHRELFVTKNQMALRVGFMFGQRRVRSGTPPSDAPVMTSGTPPSGESGFSGIPFEMIVGQVLSAVGFLLILGIAVSGIVVVLRLKKLEI